MGAQTLACACVSVALIIQHEMRRHIAVCILSFSTRFFRHYLMNDTIFEKKVIEHKMYVLIFSTTFTSNIYILTFQKEISTPCSCRILMKRVHSRQVLKKGSDIKFYQNPSNGS
jgi:hypothetical protein